MKAMKKLPHKSAINPMKFKVLFSMGFFEIPKSPKRPIDHPTTQFVDIQSRRPTARPNSLITRWDNVFAVIIKFKKN